jgi:hypothetical protein
VHSRCLLSAREDFHALIMATKHHCEKAVMCITCRIAWQTSQRKSGVSSQTQKNREFSIVLGNQFSLIFPENSRVGNSREYYLVSFLGDQQTCVWVPAEHYCLSLTSTSCPSESRRWASKASISGLSSLRYR